MPTGPSGGQFSPSLGGLRAPLPASQRWEQNGGSLGRQHHGESMLAPQEADSRARHVLPWLMEQEQRQSQLRDKR